MKAIILFIIASILSPGLSISQEISEKLIAQIDQIRSVGIYDFKYDKRSSSYCFIERSADGNRTNILSNGRRSPDLIYAIPDQIKFFRNGKYAAIADSYLSDTSSKSVLIIDGSAVQTADYMDWSSMYVNKDDELVFIMKEGEKYFLAKCSSSGKFIKSDPYDMIRACYKLEPMMMEEGDEIISDDQYTVNADGERMYIARMNGKALIISGEKVEVTPYSDIDNTSLYFDRNGKLSYIAKENGWLYDSGRGFFVIHNGNKLKMFDYIYAPLYFDKNNSVYYIAADSVGDYEYDFFVVKGDKKYEPSGDDMNIQESDIRYLTVDDNGDVSYFGYGSLKNSGIDQESEYIFTGNYYKDGKKHSLGYNPREIVFGNNGEFLYASQPAPNSKSYDLFRFRNGGSAKVNTEPCEDLMGYGFSPAGKIFYGKMSYDDTPGSYKSSVDLVFDGKKFGSYDYIIYQYLMDTIYMLSFDSKGNFAYAVSRSLDSNKYLNEVYVNGDKLPMPELATPGSGMFYNVYNLFYTANDKLFYSAYTEENIYGNEASIELFVDNRTLGKIYGSMGVVSYDKLANSASFLASRGNEVYEVVIEF